MKFTPDKIEGLDPNEVFVFGSNLRGSHGGGAALIAVQKFGAVQGVHIGHEGQSYALPTLGTSYEKLPLEDIQKYVFDLLEYAAENPSLTFLVTPIGCGIAGFTPEEIAPMFKVTGFPGNVILPEVFHLKGAKV